ncbi:histidine phosphatase family protein [Paenibacillus sp. J2TS4]|uniref:histidine phosphatase family protein n=1 Tax=Paenibacillus sp. J2TS4 TaxID=2807194 RepID=UPI001B16FB83|nr:histidine phosphatase family protein [Paenibacillus sp. J2TS4]GIP35473.1 phosphoglycerate mutase [Paenibacillus sp. J2TS4]
MTIIGFVRHGNTDWNIENRAQGHSHNPLNPTGLRQADAVGRRLAKDNWDVIISSDLLRARQTAEIISSYMGKPIKFDQRLREISRGQIEGTIEEERIERWGKEWRKLDLGGETHQELRARGVSFVEDVVDQYAGQKVLVITHGKLLIETLYALCPDETDSSDLVRNSSLTIIKKSSSGFGYLLYNCTCHLKAEELTR